MIISLRLVLLWLQFDFLRFFTVGGVLQTLTATLLLAIDQRGVVELILKALALVEQSQAHRTGLVASLAVAVRACIVNIQWHFIASAL